MANAGNHSKVAPARAGIIREVVAKPHTLLPEMPMIGWSNFTRATPRGLAPHAHAHRFEICFIIRGNVDWWVENAIFEVPRGNLYITKPNEPHGGVDAVMHPCELYWLHLAIPRTGPLPGLSRAQTRAIANALAALRFRTFPAPPVVPDYFEQILAEHRRPSNPFSPFAARAALHLLLAAVLRAHADHARHLDSQSIRRPAQIAQALQYMDDHLAQHLPVEQLAAAVGMSISHFHDRFLHHTGFSPADYHNRQRIRKAKQLLRNHALPITAIALQLGFSTSQYFATVFKHFTGISPRQYRAGNLTKDSI